MSKRPFALTVFNQSDETVCADADRGIVYVLESVANFKALPGGAHYYGFGEKAGLTLDKRGASMTFFNFDNFAYATSDAETFGKLAGAFDLIVNTVSATINADAYLSLLALDGVLANVGVATEPLSLHGSTLVSQRRIITGSLIGGISETREMLGFCAQHHLGAEIEVIPAGKINEAYERVLASDVRYRFVIDNSTLA